MNALHMRQTHQILLIFLLTSLNAVSGQQFQRSIPVPLPIVLKNNPLLPLPPLPQSKSPFNIYSLINNVKHFFQNPRSSQHPTTLSPQLTNLLSNPTNQILLESLLSSTADSTIPSRKFNNIKSKMTKNDNDDDNTVVLAAPYSVSSDVIKTLVHIAESVKDQDKKVEMMEKVLQYAKPKNHSPEPHQHHVINSNSLPIVEAASNNIHDLMERDKLVQLLQQQQILMAAQQQQQQPHAQLVVAPKPLENHPQIMATGKSDSVKKFVLKSKHKQTPNALSSVLNHYGIDAQHLKYLLNSKANELKKLQGLFQPHDNGYQEEEKREKHIRAKATIQTPKENSSNSDELNLIRSMLVKLNQDELNTVGKLVRLVIKKPHFLPRILNEGLSDKVKRVLQVIQVLKFPETMTEKNKFVHVTTMPPINNKQWDLRPRLSPDQISVKKDSLVPLLYWLSNSKEPPPKSTHVIENQFIPYNIDYFQHEQFGNRRSFVNESTNPNSDLLLNVFSERTNRVMSGTDDTVYEALPSNLHIPSSSWINSTTNNPYNHELYYNNPAPTENYPYYHSKSTTMASVDKQSYWQNTGTSGDWIPLVPNQPQASRQETVKENLQTYSPIQKQFSYGSKIAKKKHNLTASNSFASREGYYELPEELPTPQKLYKPRRKQKVIVYSSDEVQSEETKIDETISQVHVGRAMDFNREREHTTYKSSNKKKYAHGSPLRSKNSYKMQFDSSMESDELERSSNMKRMKLPSSRKYKIVDWASGEELKVDFQQPITIIPCSSTTEKLKASSTEPPPTTTTTISTEESTVVDGNTSSTTTVEIPSNTSDYSTVVIQQAQTQKLVNETKVTHLPVVVIDTTTTTTTQTTTTEEISSTTTTEDSVTTTSTTPENLSMESLAIYASLVDNKTIEVSTVNATTTDAIVTEATTTTTTTEKPTTTTSTTTTPTTTPPIIEFSTEELTFLPDFKFLFSRNSPKTSITSPFPVYIHTDESSTTQTSNTEKSPLRLLYDFYMRTTTPPPTSTSTEEYITPDVVVSMESDVNKLPTTTTTTTISPTSFLDLFKPKKLNKNVFTRTNNPHENVKSTKSKGITLRGTQPRQVKAKARDNSELSGYFPMGYWPKLHNKQNSDNEETQTVKPNIKLRWLPTKSKNNRRK